MHHNSCVLISASGFDSYLQFFDGQSLKAIYFIPKASKSKKNWSEANLACTKELFSELGTNRPLTLPLGINTAELNFLKSLDLMRGSQMTPLGLVRSDVVTLSPNMSSSFETYSDQMPRIVINNETNLEFWEEGSDKQRVNKAYLYGCMDLDSKFVRRSVCRNGFRQFICAKYGKNEADTEFSPKNGELFRICSPLHLFWNTLITVLYFFCFFF